jgi:putative DNA primase/helicase
MPEGVVNRAADNWRPLVAIADVVGGRWRARVRKAIIASVPETIEEASQIELLLGDIRDIFAAVSGDRISSEALTEKLKEVEGRPWAEFDKNGKPITPNKLARLLKRPGLGVAPGLIRIGDGVARGYQRHQFKEAFARFLPEGGPHTVTPLQMQQTRALLIFPNRYRAMTM